mgnify:CR=1 FL=1
MEISAFAVLGGCLRLEAARCQAPFCKAPDTVLLLWQVFGCCVMPVPHVIPAKAALFSRPRESGDPGFPIVLDSHFRGNDAKTGFPLARE